MPISPYLRELRRQIGTSLVLMPVVGAIIRDAQGLVLLEQRCDNGAWCLPGGAIDPGESPTVAVVREVYEETGLRVTPTALIGVFGPQRHRYPNGDEAEFTHILLSCQVTGGTLQASDGESIAFSWFRPQDIPELGIPPSFFRWQPGQPSLFEG